MERNNRHMPALFLSIFRFVRLLTSGHQAVAIENAALRLQLAAFQRKHKRPVLTTFDSGVLDRSPPLVVWMAWPLGLCTGGYRRALAARAVSQVLGPAIEAAAPSPRPARYRGRDSPIDPTNGGRQSAVACATNSRRTEDAWHHDLRAHGLSNSATPSPAAESDLEDVSSQPHRPPGFDRFLYRSNGHHAGAVRVHRLRTPSSGGAALQCHRESHRGLDVPTNRRGFCR